MCTKPTDLNHISERLENNKMRIPELNVSPMFDLMNKSVLNLNSIQPTMSASSSIIENAFGLQISSQESSKTNKFFCTAVFLTIQILHLEQTRGFQSLFA